jgi:ribosomal protein S18 acetylase RimI-like enzyme
MSDSDVTNGMGVRDDSTAKAIAIAIDQLLALEAEGFAAEKRWSAQLWEDEFDQGHRVLGICDSNGVLLAAAVVSIVAEVADLRRIVVADAAKRQGVGTCLLAAVLGDAATLGAEQVFLEVAERNTPALALYRKFGFTLVSRRPGYYQNGEDALIMERPLTSIPLTSISLVPSSPSSPSSIPSPNLTLCAAVANGSDGPVQAIGVNQNRPSEAGTSSTAAVHLKILTLRGGLA